MHVYGHPSPAYSHAPAPTSLPPSLPLHRVVFPGMKGVTAAFARGIHHCADGSGGGDGDNGLGHLVVEVKGRTAVVLGVNMMEGGVLGGSASEGRGGSWLRGA